MADSHPAKKHAPKALQQALDIWSAFKRTHAGAHAASTAFFFFLSLFPLIIIVAGIVTSVGGDEQSMIAFFCSMVPESLEGFVRAVVHEAYANAGIACSISLLTLLWSASRGMRVLRGGLNVAYGIGETRPGPVVVGISIIALIVLIIALTVAMSLVFSGVIARMLDHVIPGSLNQDAATTLVNTLLMIVFGTLVFALCYTYLAAGTREFRAQLPGAAIAAVAWAVLSFGFRIYVENFSNFTLLYGSLAAVALFLFWMYLVFYILLAGAFINHYQASKTNEISAENV